MIYEPASGAAQRPDCDHAKAQRPPEWRHLVIGVKVVAARWSQFALERWSRDRHGRSTVPDCPQVAAGLGRELARRGIRRAADWAGSPRTGVPGLRIFHDLTASYGNIDHVVIGPGGVIPPRPDFGSSTTKRLYRRRTQGVTPANRPTLVGCSNQRQQSSRLDSRPGQDSVQT